MIQAVVVVNTDGVLMLIDGEGTLKKEVHFLKTAIILRIFANL